VRIADRGLALEVPSGWEARIFVPAAPPPAINLPIVHASSVVLPTARSSFATEATPSLGSAGVLISLVEFEAALAGVGLYAARGIPSGLRRAELDPAALQVPHPRQGGVQRFFSEAGRAFCLYVVAGLGPGLAERLGRANDVIASLRVDAAAGGAG
jgi:hypothetical protein